MSRRAAAARRATQFKGRIREFGGAIARQVKFQSFDQSYTPYLKYPNITVRPFLVPFFPDFDSTL